VMPPRGRGGAAEGAPWGREGGTVGPRGGRRKAAMGTPCYTFMYTGENIERYRFYVIIWRFLVCFAVGDLYQDRYVNGGHGPIGPHGPMGPMGPIGPWGPFT